VLTEKRLSDDAENNTAVTFSSIDKPPCSSGTYGVFVVVAVDMWPNDGEIFETLRWRRVGNVDNNAKVISDRADSALERARQTLLG